MAVREVLKMGDPRLLKKAESVNLSEITSPEIQALIHDVLDTMYFKNGAGLAAPQIGIDLQIVAFGFEKNSRYPHAQPIPETVLINPVITPLSDEIQDGWEGCLSVPGLRGVVPRYKQIRYQGYDQFGKPIDRTVSDFHARVVQHECDHLDGKLFPMRVQDFSKFGFTEVLFPELG
jgi:peptide deformylase